MLKPSLQHYCEHLLLMFAVSPSKLCRNLEKGKQYIGSKYSYPSTSPVTKKKSSNLNLKLFQTQHVCTLAMNAVTALPALATGKVFDFNATLPAMVVNFLLLMVFLEKTWFGPVGKVLDERDAKIRARLGSVKTGDDELASLTKESESLLKEARSEAQNKIADARSNAAAKASALLTTEKAKLDE
jgi:F-type H+-transporting ATPase subunit b